MAKKKAQSFDRSDIEKEIYSKFNIDTDKYFNDIVSGESYPTFSVSPRIDQACGGGIKEGTLTLISGPEKVGKTTLCLQVAASAQNYNEDGIQRKIYYVDVENRLQKRDLKIDGLDTTDKSKFEVIGSTELNILSAEDVFQFIENLARKLNHCVIIVDSFSMLCSKSEMAYDFNDGMRPDVPKMSAVFCRKMAQILRPSHNTILGILHQHANQNARGPMSPQKQEGGGTKLQYLSDYKFVLTWKESDPKNAEVKTGHLVHFKCVWNPKDSPSSESHFYHKFGVGIDKHKEAAEMAKDFGIVSTKGNWFELEDGKKFNGLDQFTEYLRQNNEVFNEIMSKINEITM